ncbi:MAG: 16S rRNA (uracil(1498)-N(3))-methyltransferase [Rikenellaceae bacterium]
MQLFYAPDFTSPRYTLSEEESKHCVRVLRRGIGDTLHITDGAGNLFYCRIVSDNAKRCEVEVVSVSEEYEKLSYNLTMAVAPTKNIERFEWFLEKATEVGVGQIIPLLVSHSERKTIKYDRQLRVITSAMKQSLKAYHPILRDITPLAELLKESFAGERYIAHCGESVTQGVKPHLADVVRAKGDVMILIGPEGDFSPEEVKEAVAAGFVEISLGEQRLRTETAAVASTVIVATKGR